MSSPNVGVLPQFQMGSHGHDSARALLARAADAGIDHVLVGDHVSFFVGLGGDGLMRATALSMLHPTLPVYTAVYLLPLRHPVLEGEAAGRAEAPRQHAMQVWCGIAGSHEEARSLLAPTMQAVYQLPFERFEKYSPARTPEDVAGFLSPYAEAGCTTFNLIPQSPDPQGALEGVAEVKRLLTRP
jgi:hypothetical protein